MMLRAVSSLLAIVMLLLSVYAFRHAYAAALDYQARRYEMLWKQTAAPADLDQWQRAVDWSARALSIDSNNPFMHLRHSRLRQWYGRVPEMDSEEYRRNLAIAENHVATAVHLHPNSADTISSRAELAAVRGLVNDELNADILRSLEMGPWERDVYRRAMRAALFNWPRLEDSTRTVLRAYFDTAVNDKPRVAAELFVLAEDYGRLPVLCARLQYLQSAGLTEFSSRRCEAL